MSRHSEIFLNTLESFMTLWKTVGSLLKVSKHYEMFQDLFEGFQILWKVSKRLCNFGPLKVSGLFWKFLDTHGGPEGHLVCDYILSKGPKGPSVPTIRALLAPQVWLLSVKQLSAGAREKRPIFCFFSGAQQFLINKCLIPESENSPKQPSIAWWKVFVIQKIKMQLKA